MYKGIQSSQSVLFVNIKHYKKGPCFIALHYETGYLSLHLLQKHLVNHFDAVVLEGASAAVYKSQPTAAEMPRCLHSLPSSSQGV